MGDTNLVGINNTKAKTKQTSLSCHLDISLKSLQELISVWLWMMREKSMFGATMAMVNSEMVVSEIQMNPF